MNLKALLKPTKPKVIGIILLILGALVIKALSFLQMQVLVRNLSPEEYGLWISSNKPLILLGILLLLNWIWVYIVICIVFHMSKKQ